MFDGIAQDDAAQLDQDFEDFLECFSDEEDSDASTPQRESFIEKEELSYRYQEPKIDQQFSNMNKINQERKLLICQSKQKILNDINKFDQPEIQE